MLNLIQTAKPAAASMFSAELLIAIFWEESMFNNIPQEGGTAWGFGQCEPAEYWTLNPKLNPAAVKFGYAVPGLPHVVNKRLQGQLTPEQSVKVAAGALCHVYYNVKQSQKTALYAYAGVGYQGTDVADRLKKRGARQAIVADWQACEAYLQGTQPAGSDYPAFIKSGLRLAKPFKVDDPDFHRRLFPEFPLPKPVS